MFVLFETPAGYALFKVSSDVKKLDADDIWRSFTTPEQASQSVKLKAFQQFTDTQAALAAATAICDAKLDKGLKSFLSDSLTGKKEAADKVTLGVSDSKLAGLIKDKLGVKCVWDNTVNEILRGIRNHMSTLIQGLSPQDNQAFTLGLSHSLCRYKLKFSPDKVDTMIIQAIALLDELDKELNTYAMRVREWYGWHFPEMGKIVQDNIQYAKVVMAMKIRTSASSTDFSDILEEEIETALKEAAEVSMGTEIAEEDIENITALCQQVISIAEYRATLYDYLKQRMAAIAPNLTAMVGELVGARLIAHAGSLISLAKFPASTVQILGAEKALFRALKTKHSTPKYGLIYHASLVGQAAPKIKGKVSRMLAAKTALSARTDALGESEDASVGLEGRAKVEARLAVLEGNAPVSRKSTGQTATPSRPTQPIKSYSGADDIVMSTPSSSNGDKEKKKKDKKDKKDKKRKIDDSEDADGDDSVKDEPEKKKKKKDKKSKE